MKAGFKWRLLVGLSVLLLATFYFGFGIDLKTSLVLGLLFGGLVTWRVVRAIDKRNKRGKK